MKWKKKVTQDCACLFSISNFKLRLPFLNHIFTSPLLRHHSFDCCSRQNPGIYITLNAGPLSRPNAFATPWGSMAFILYQPQSSPKLCVYVLPMTANPPTKTLWNFFFFEARPATFRMLANAAITQFSKHGLAWL
jgi:hypothetical protein